MPELQLPPGAVVRFDAFTFDVQAGGLWRGVERLDLQDLPVRLLALLVAARGAVVTREELQRRLWPADRQVDFEVGLNTAIRKLRAVLGDDAREPHLIETVRGYGYRLLPAIEFEVPAEMAPRMLPAPACGPAPPAQRGWFRWGVTSAAGLGLAAAIWWMNPLPPPSVTRIYPLTNSGRLDDFMRPASDGTRLFYEERDGPRWTLSAARLDGGGSTALPAAPFDNRYVLGVWPDHTQYLVGSFEGYSDYMPLYAQPASGGTPRRLGALHGNAVLSPDGRWIASGEGHNLWLAASDGSGAHRLGTWPALHPDFPVFSPNGREVAFTLNDMHGDLRTQWTIGTDGSGLRQVLPGWTQVPQEGHGAWSADGRYFVFASNHAGRRDLWALRLHGEWWRRSPAGPFRLTVAPLRADNAMMFDNAHVYFYSDAPAAELVTLGTDRSLHPFLPGVDALQPAFSRDGQWVAYTATDGIELWRARADGSDRRRLLDNSWQVSFPRWSPAGDSLVMVARRFGEPNRLWLINRDGGAPRLLAPQWVEMHTPEWLPEGGAVLFAGPAAHPGMERLNLAAGPPQLWEGGLKGGFPRWSPDGRYLSMTTDNDARILLYDRTTQQVRTLAEGLELSLSAWSADGAWIYYQEQAMPGVPLYRVSPRGGAPELVADLGAQLQLDTHHLDFFGLTPDGRPLFARWRNNANIYAADVTLP